MDASQTVKMTLAACGDILGTMKSQYPNEGAHPALAAPKPVSIHRAFVYSASFPGIGEIYAYRPIRGWITVVLFSAMLAWFGVTFFQIAGALKVFRMPASRICLGSGWRSHLPPFIFCGCGR